MTVITLTTDNHHDVCCLDSLNLIKYKLSWKSILKVSMKLV